MNEYTRNEYKKDPSQYMDRYKDPFSICFNVLKIRYKDYDNYLCEAHDEIPAFLHDKDQVNCFINLESMFQTLCSIRDLEDALIRVRNYPNIIISNIFNLAVHYKRYFTVSEIPCRIYFYYTSLDSNSDDFYQAAYTSDYRAYYLMKYTKNPKYVRLMDSLRDRILPNVETICGFIPDVYYINAKNIDGSLVPYIIGKQDPTRKNIIVTTDFAETQYSLIENYFASYIHSTFKRTICNNHKESLEAVVNSQHNRKADEMASFYKTYQYYGLYCSLMTVLGSKNRSLFGISGYGPSVLEKNLKKAINDHLMKYDTTSPELIGQIFQEEVDKKDFIDQFNCLNVESGYTKLSEADLLSITNQIVNRVDMNSLTKINNDMLSSCPIQIEWLV